MTKTSARVLLVDDNPRGLEFLDLRLKALGYQTQIVHSGELAIDVFSRERPDIVVLDVTMPEVNGYQACRAMKRIDANIPIVILTAKSDPADRFWGLQAGADAFLNKPIDPVQVVDKLKALLDGS